MSEFSTCHICKEDYPTEDTFEDINGARYCWVHAGNICVVCGIYDHDCEGASV